MQRKMSSLCVPNFDLASRELHIYAEVIATKSESTGKPLSPRP